MGTPNVDSVQQGRGRDGAPGPFSRSGAVRRLALPAAALSLALGAAQLAAAAPSLAATPSPSRVAVGHTPSLPKGSAAAAAPSASTKLSLDIQLSTGRAAELSAYAAGVGDRNSPYYHQYLTPSQVAEYFGASSAEISAVESALAGEGLTVGTVSADKMFISASGTVAQAEHAFNVTIAGYRANGRTFYANTAAPTVPATVAGDFAAVVGLDDVAYARPDDALTGHTVKAPATTATKSAAASPAYTVNSCSEINTLFDGSGYSNGDGYYNANTLSSIYGLSPLVTGGNDGAGVTVAVYELETYDPTGVKDIDSCYGHSNSVSEVKVDGGPSTPVNLFSPDNPGAESALDIEDIANLAPGASIIDYAGPDWQTATEAQSLDVYSTIFNQDKAQVVSISWAECEQLSDSSALTEENTLFEQAATQGQTVVAASGDAGSTACYDPGVDDDSVLAVNDPASQPYVTGVGGTTMSGLSASPTPAVWNSGCYVDDDVTYCGATGGGVSSSWPLPSYQSGVTGSGYTENCTTATTGCRQVPDVSALADPDEGYVIDLYGSDTADGDGPGEYYTIIGGTSGSTPTWAAIFALADATTTCRLNGEAGFVNPDLYAAAQGSSSASTFTDVTSGSNGLSGYDATYSYPATTGYDLSTGWGTPIAKGVVASVCQAPIATSASSYFVSDGPTRIMDTRKDIGAGGPVAVDGTATLQVGGVDGVPSDGTVTAVVLNVTVANPTGGGYATVYPTDRARTSASNINFSAGEAIPNLVTVPVDADGEVSFYNASTGTAQFVADLEGYYTTNSAVSGASTYVADGPSRVLDTRKSIGATGPVAALGTAKLTLAGVDKVPSDGTVTSVVLNVTVTAPTGGGYATVYPDGTAKTSASNVNFSKGETIPNLVTVPLGSDGAVDLYNDSTGTVQFVADLEGYYEQGTGGAKYHALNPTRLIDTRHGEGETSVSPLAKSGGTLTLALPPSYSAVVANLTVTAPVGGGYLSVYPIGGTPSSSSVNFSANETIANLGLITSKSGIVFSNQATGTTQLVMDLEGYFSAS
jgi:Pro-kumamolisin, activation domain